MAQSLPLLAAALLLAPHPANAGTIDWGSRGELAGWSHDETVLLSYPDERPYLAGLTEGMAKSIELTSYAIPSGERLHRVALPLPIAGTDRETDAWHLAGGYPQVIAAFRRLEPEEPIGLLLSGYEFYEDDGSPFGDQHDVSFAAVTTWERLPDLKPADWVRLPLGHLIASADEGAVRLLGDGSLELLRHTTEIGFDPPVPIAKRHTKEPTVDRVNIRADGTITQGTLLEGEYLALAADREWETLYLDPVLTRSGPPQIVRLGDYADDPYDLEADEGRETPLRPRDLVLGTRDAWHGHGPLHAYRLDYDIFDKRQTTLPGTLTLSLRIVESERMMKRRQPFLELPIADPERSESCWGGYGDCIGLTVHRHPQRGQFVLESLGEPRGTDAAPGPISEIVAIRLPESAADPHPQRSLWATLRDGTQVRRLNRDAAFSFGIDTDEEETRDSHVSPSGRWLLRPGLRNVEVIDLDALFAGE